MSLIVVIDTPMSECEGLGELTMSLAKDAEIRLYHDPHELLSGIAIDPPDLLIANGHLKGMSAKELIDRFRSIPSCRDVPAVVLVSYGTRGWQEVSFKSGVTEYAVMPMDQEELALRSKHLITSRVERKCRVLNSDSDGRPVDVETTDAAANQLSRITALDGLIQTLSAKLIIKIAEIDRLRGELQSLVDATSIAAVFLDNESCIRHFTPQILSFYEISDGDIGRPLQDIPCKLGQVSLASNIQLARTTGSTIDRYLEQHASETYFQMRFTPNRSRDGVVWGMTVTFVQVNLRSPGRA